MRALIPLMLIALIATPCLAQLGPNQISGRVLGKNLFGDLVPLAWAQVVAYAGGVIVNAVSTADNGFYIMFLPPGTYEIAVYYPGYVIQRQSVTASGAILANINFYLEQGVNLYVKTDPEIIGGVPGEGTYLRGAAVTLNVTRPIVEISKGKRYVFAGWGGDVTGATPTITVVLDTSKSVIATYKVQNLLLLYLPGMEPVERWLDQGTEATTPSAESLIESGPGMRLLFQTWLLDGVPVAGNPIKAVMDRPHNASAHYKAQYYVRVLSDVARPSGEGWYDADSSATISVPSQVSVEGFLGALGGRKAFSGWSGDIQSFENPLAIKVNKPYTLRANWSNDYFQPTAVFAALLIALGVIGAGLVAWAKRRLRRP